MLSKDKIEVDFIISLGNSCQTAYYLRKHNLSYVSNPLDWMRDYSLDSAIHWFKNSYYDFFLEIFENEELDGVDGNRNVVDKNTGTLSVHYFPVEKTLVQGHKEFRKLMLKRTKRMEKIIKNTEKILFISHRNNEKKDFCRFLHEFKDLYDKKLIYLNIYDDRTLSEDICNKYTKTITNDLKFIQYTFKNVNKDGDIFEENNNSWKGNEEKWDKIMETISISKKFTQLKYFLEK